MIVDRTKNDVTYSAILAEILPLRQKTDDLGHYRSAPLIFAQKLFCRIKTFSGEIKTKSLTKYKLKVEMIIQNLKNRQKNVKKVFSHFFSNFLSKKKSTLKETKTFLTFLF